MQKNQDWLISREHCPLISFQLKAYQKILIMHFLYTIFQLFYRTIGWVQIVEVRRHITCSSFRFNKNALVIILLSSILDQGKPWFAPYNVRQRSNIGLLCFKTDDKTLYRSVKVVKDLVEQQIRLVVGTTLLLYHSEINQQL